MRGFRRQKLVVALTGLLCLGAGVPAEAGLIPWAYNAVFGTGPVYGGYAYGYAPPAYGYGAAYSPVWTQSSYYSPAWSTYTVGYAPAFSYASYGIGIANYGYATPCCSCAPCSCDPCGGVGCSGGDCSTGNCGAGYTPDIKNGPTPEPTPTHQPPAADPPANRPTPPVDDFTRVPPRTNDNPMPGGSVPANTSPPSSTIPNSTIPGSTIPNTTIPNSTLPGGSTVPGSGLPGGSTIPRSNAIPEVNDLPNATPFNGGSGSSVPNNGGFEPPMDRNSVPYELNKPDLGTESGPTGLHPVPLEIEPAAVARVQIHRERIVSQAGYRFTPVARLAISPRLIPAELAQK